MLQRFADAAYLVTDDLGLRLLVGEFGSGTSGGTTTLMSNRALSEWGPLFNDELLASGAMDQRLHHRHIVRARRRLAPKPPRCGRNGALP